MSWLVVMSGELQGLTYLVSLLSVPVATIQFVISKRNEQKARENATYDALDIRYVEFLKICLENPDLPLFDGSNYGNCSLTAQQRYRMEIAFSMLTAILERAYLMYRGESDRFRCAQWEGWQAYIDHYLAYPRYERFWKLAGSQFDADFFGFMERRRILLGGLAVAKAVAEDIS